MPFSLPSSVVEEIIKKGYLPQPGQEPEAPAATPEQPPAPAPAPAPANTLAEILERQRNTAANAATTAVNTPRNADTDAATQAIETFADNATTSYYNPGAVDPAKLQGGGYFQPGDPNVGKTQGEVSQSGDQTNGGVSSDAETEEPTFLDTTTYEKPTMERLSDYGDTIKTIIGAAPTVTYNPASATTVDPNADARSREAIWQNIAALQGAAAGTAPSAAEIQMRQGLDAAIRSQMAQSASARGVSAGLAQKIAAEGIAGQQQAAVNETARMRAAEQAQARATLADVLTGTRGMDLETAYRNQQAINDIGALNADLGLRASTTNADIRSKYGISAAEIASGLYSGDTRSYTDLESVLLGLKGDKLLQDDQQEFIKSQFSDEMMKLIIGGLLSGAGSGTAAYLGKK